MKQVQCYISWENYLLRFEELLNTPEPLPPYDNPIYLDYLKLNRSRQNRWLKKTQLIPDLIEVIRSIHTPQEWIIITEPWCGDAAHSIPFIYLMAKENPFIKLKFIWRDQPPFLIDQYLTNGGKAVPKLIIRNESQEDLATWGPRPEPCQSIYLSLKNRNASFEEQKITLQNWYNGDKGQTIQAEIIEILKGIR